MSKLRLFERIILIELIGFFIVILFLWIDEIYDLPHHLFGTESTPVNLMESIFESTVLLLFGIIVVLFTLRLLARTKYVEGYLPLCPVCKKVRVKNIWIPFEDYIKNYSDAELSRDLCPECINQEHRKFLNNDDEKYN
jgi:hypothetical protein